MDYTVKFYQNKGVKAQTVIRAAAGATSEQLLQKAVRKVWSKYHRFQWDPSFPGQGRILARCKRCRRDHRLTALLTPIIFESATS